MDDVNSKQSRMALLLLLVLLNLSLSSTVEVLVTDCQTAELKYHLTTFTLRLSETIHEKIVVELKSEDDNIAFPLQTNFTFLPEHGTMPQVVFVYGQNIGKTNIDVTPIIFSNHTGLITSRKKVEVLVVHSLTLHSISMVIGWIYFIAWIISFYPQLYENYKYRSVIGLNFDLVFYNFSGYFCYSVYNVGLFYIKAIQDQYFAEYRGSVVPVESNDVFFGLYAFALVLVSVVQCCVYEKGDQGISLTAKIFTAIFWLFLGISLIPTLVHKITWLTYLQFFSYVKLGITLIKYIPQALMNYRRKSTVGWNIWNVLLDVVGGSFSLMQMFFLAYNNNEWNSIFGDFTKFGLGLFSLLFDAVFITQHYVLYPQRRHDNSPVRRRNSYEKINEREEGSVNRAVNTAES